mmetsp:Transcript_937/g.1114  ORF Transcript_937/g.1114 Transcript_937/m.1114 type:complete len:295 (-) Transcript_937:54-938(-)
MKVDPGSKVVIHGDVAVIQLTEGQKLRAEHNATIGRNVTISTALTGEGSWLVTRLARAAYNKAVGGEGALAQWFEGPGEVLISDPLFPGRIVEFGLAAGDVLFMKKGAWLASDKGIVIAPRLEGFGSLALNTLKGTLGKAWLQQAKADEAGRVYLSSFGAIHHKMLGEGESYRVDNSNLLAWTSTGKKSTHLAGGLMNAYATGEGFEFAFEGPCDIFMESGSKDSFLKSLVQTDGFMKALVSSPHIESHIQTKLQPLVDRIDKLNIEVADLKSLQNAVGVLKDTILANQIKAKL